jgi:hypothetical protein
MSPVFQRSILLLLSKVSLWRPCEFNIIISLAMTTAYSLQFDLPQYILIYHLTYHQYPQILSSLQELRHQVFRILFTFLFAHIPATRLAHYY